jgi:hypothetical protein
MTFQATIGTIGISFKTITRIFGLLEGPQARITRKTLI